MLGVPEYCQPIVPKFLVALYAYQLFLCKVTASKRHGEASDTILFPRVCDTGSDYHRGSLPRAPKTFNMKSSKTQNVQRDIARYAQVVFHRPYTELGCGTKRNKLFEVSAATPYIERRHHNGTEEH